MAPGFVYKIDIDTLFQNPYPPEKKEESKCYVCDHMKPEFQGKGRRFKMRHILEEVHFEGTPYECSWPTVVAPSKFCGECGKPLLKVSDG